MDQHERMLIAFLAGDLDEESSRRWDEHLLGCERCWRAVREDRLGLTAAARLRESAPPELAERVRFAVQLAQRPSRRRRPLRWVVAGGGLVAAAATVTAVALSTSARPADPPAIAAVVHVAQDMPAPAIHNNPPGVPEQLGPPAEMVAGGAHVRLWHYRIGDVHAVVARSDQAFPMPAELTTAAMPWTVTRGRVALYCLHSDTVVAAPVPAGELPALAGRLPVPD